MSEPVVALQEWPASPAPPHRIRRFLNGLVRIVVSLSILTGLTALGYFTREHWIPLLIPNSKTEVATESDEHTEAETPSQQILLTEQAQKNLRLTAKPLKPETFWKTISVPGMVTDRPGVSDRGVVAPVTGVVSRIHKLPGDSARPGEVLVSLKLLSESLHLTQTELFKSAQDITLAEAQLKRLKTSTGSISEARIIEAENQIARLAVAVKAYRQELLNRGLSPEQIDGVGEGKFVNELSIVVPSRMAPLQTPITKSMAELPAYEIQELKVELGQQVQAGQTLCLLANHRLLAVEGRVFRDESPLLERGVKENWPVEVDFGEMVQDWPPLEQTFHVTYIANFIDPESRTFRFLMPLDNQSRTVDKDGRTLTLWRFRPGQRVRLFVRVEKIENVFVLPTDAVTREGAEAYVFRQNGDVFDRKPVQVIYQDRDNAVIANDGSVPAGVYVAQTGAAQLNRMIKAQSSTMPKGFHIHADGSVHMSKH